MPFTVTMPKLSPTMEEGMIAKWHKKIGEKTASGELLVEIATDKATIEYNALDAGFLRVIVVPEGTSVKVNDPIAVFTETAEESIKEYIPQKIASSEPEKAAQRKEEPKETESEAKAPKDGEKYSLFAPSFVPEPPLEHYEFAFPAERASARVAASPLAKKLAKEKGIDLTIVRGSGPSGRIISRDLDLAQPNQTVGFGPRALPAETPGTYEEVPLSPMRKKIAQRLSEAKTFIPHIYVRQEVDGEPLFQAREQLKSGNLKVTVNDFVIRACALALREHPIVNSGFHPGKQSILSFKTIDIAVAVTVDGGLITPIIRHADYKGLGDLSVEMKELASRAKRGKLEPFEYKGGSFTISNLGMFGVNDFCAIINPPQAAILAVGGIIEAPCVRKGAVVAGKVMNLVLSADHRVIDGAEAAKFLKTVQKYIENPSLLLI